jgi:hypothetical protein
MTFPSGRPSIAAKLLSNCGFSAGAAAGAWASVRLLLL